LPIQPNNSVDLTVTGGVPGYTYLWSNDSITEDLNMVEADTYVVTITDANTCTKVDSIALAPAIVFDFGAAPDTTICPGDSIQLTAWANVPQWNTNFYHWIGSPYISDTLSQTPTVYPLDSTYFYLVVDSICLDTARVLIQVHDTIGLYAGLDETIMKDQTVQLEASQHDSLLNYLWSPALGLSNDSIYNPIAGPKQTITYILRALNTYGCYEYDTLVVNVIPDLIFPTGITPNGDGVNDDWIIDYVDKFPDIEVEVYNRWGEQLFYSKGYPDEERWDGTFKGKDLPVGTYYYLIRLNDGVHNEPYSGPITIVR